nr:hypothetical protein [uncultured Prevotella sp.]
MIKFTSEKGTSIEQILFLIKRAEAPHAWCGWSTPIVRRLNTNHLGGL